MYVEVQDGRAELRDADNCRALEVRVAAGQRPSRDAALRDAGLGFWDGGAETELSVTRLRDAAASADVGPEWTQRWDAMVTYAATKGWLTPDGAALRAHVVDVERR